MKYYVDGFTIKSNPSIYGGGFSVIDQHNSYCQVHFVKKDNFTNNEAEILALNFICKECEESSEIFTDSMNSIYWSRNGKSKARPDLNNLLTELKKIILNKKLIITFVPRENNLAGIYNEENSKSFNINFGI